MNYMNGIMENMLKEFLYQLGDIIELDSDELIEEYIEKPKLNPTECFLSRLEKQDMKPKKIKKDKKVHFRCKGRIYTEKCTDGMNRGQCMCEQGDNKFCKRHSKKRPHGSINEPVYLMKTHDFKVKEQYYPIVIDNVSYMYEPFTQIAINLKTNKNNIRHLYFLLIV